MGYVRPLPPSLDPPRRPDLTLPAQSFITGFFICHSLGYGAISSGVSTIFVGLAEVRCRFSSSPRAHPPARPSRSPPSLVFARLRLAPRNCTRTLPSCAAETEQHPSEPTRADADPLLPLQDPEVLAIRDPVLFELIRQTYPQVVTSV